MAEKKRLDLLVNDVWGGDELTEWGKMFWELSWSKGAQMFQRAIHSHIITSQLAVPLMLDAEQGIIFEMTDGDHFGYRLNLYYDLVKISVIRLAFAMARDLSKHSITSLAVTPGYMRSEAVLDHWGVTEDNWKEGVKKDPHFIASETPFYVGRAIAALASDPDVSKKSGKVFSSWDLALEYGFTDVDGRQPHWSKYVEELTGKLPRKCDETFYAYWFEGPLDVLFPDWPSRSEIY
jgi:NAD(P)-dependent dehydrogenase (short-subunit alcohol dehydrogenase family)